MSIVLLHNTYRQAGGEDSVFAAEERLLKTGDIPVTKVIVSNDSVSGLSSKVQAFLKAPYDPARKAWLRNVLQETGADLIHIHNFFPLLTPAIHEAASQAGIPVVQTLHNFRLLCANALFLRDGHVCEKCLHSSPYWGVVHRCYRGSVPGSFAVARMIAGGRRRGIWQHHVTRFIALTEFARNKFIEGGLPAERIVVKPNFVEDPGVYSRSGAGARKGALFVGRLSEEKGVDKLLAAWSQLHLSGVDIPLRIAGVGPLEQDLRKAAPAYVTFLGQLTSAQVRHEMAGAQLLLMPSIWYEGFPLTLVEAYACGLPVLASDIGSLGELVDHRETGYLATPGDAADLARTVADAFAAPQDLQRLSHSARRRYEEKYTPKENLRQLLAIYEEAKQEMVSRQVSR